jgi:uncharacterized protein
MQAACMPFAQQFITPMAAVAGAVAETLIAFYASEPGIGKAIVNNGGDIALHLAEGEVLRVGIVGNAYAPQGDGVLTIDGNSAVRGIATSGWRGRSFSLGIADAVTVLARSASEADAAATMVANAVHVDDPAIHRAPANTLKDDTDLGALLVTIDVGPLAPRARAAALSAGEAVAHALRARGCLIGAALLLQGEWRTVGTIGAIHGGAHGGVRQ